MVLLDFGRFVFICGSGWFAIGDFYRPSSQAAIALRLLTLALTPRPCLN
jgi:hypothetical protein